MKADRAIMLSALFGIVFAANGAGAQEMKETTVKRADIRSLGGRFGGERYRR